MSLFTSARLSPFAGEAVAFIGIMCETSFIIDVERGDDDVIDETLLDCFLELRLRQRIESAANYANAVARLRRIRPVEAPERAT